MSFRKHITLSNGAQTPQIGLGTWLSAPKEVENAVEIAIRNGYRHLDLAMIHENQDEVGAALKKVHENQDEVGAALKKPEQVEKELYETLKQLGIEYLDLYLIHWPIAFPPGNGLNPPHPTKRGELAIATQTTLVETWKAMIALPKSKVCAIGVSNFTVEQLKGIISATGVIPQIKLKHPLLPQDELVAYCKKNNIHMTAYGPLVLGVLKLIENEVVLEVAKELNATPAQVLITWAAYRGYAAIPKSIQEGRIISNFKQVELSKEDYEKISSIGHQNHTRFNIPFTHKPKWDVNVFDEPIENGAEFRASSKIQ